MNSSALISVITPSYGSARSLPMALASLVAQTHAHWECIVVDDGSWDDVAAVVDAFGDPRVSIVRLSRNQGRPVARQMALQRVRGKYVAFLDADDWYYPDKLASQLELLEAHSELALVSCGMAIVDGASRLLGVRRFAKGSELEVYRQEGFEGLYFSAAGALIRASLVKELTYDMRLVRSEDQDFLMRLLKGRSYGVTAQIGYVYAEEHSSEAIEQALLAFRCQRLIYRKYFRLAPMAARREYLKTFVKSAVYRGALVTGMGEGLFSRRNQVPTEEEVRGFEGARDAVARFL